MGNGKNITENEEAIPEFEYDKKNDKQNSLVKLMLKDLKIMKKIKEANEQKQKLK